MARVRDEDVKGYAKQRNEKRGFESDEDKPKFVEHVGKATYALISLFHVRSKEGKWGIYFVFMRVDVATPEFLAVEAWNADQVHRVIVEGFGWMKGYENALPENAFDQKFNPEADIFVEMWEIATCADLKDKDGKWLSSASSKRSPYVEIVTESETYEGKDRVRAKWVNRSREIGTDGPFYVHDYRDRYRAAMVKDGPIAGAKKWYAGFCANKVKVGTEGAAKKNGGGSGGGGGDSYTEYDNDSRIPF